MQSRPRGRKGGRPSRAVSRPARRCAIFGRTLSASSDPIDKTELPLPHRRIGDDGARSQVMRLDASRSNLLSGALFLCAGIAVVAFCVEIVTGWHASNAAPAPPLGLD